MSFWTSNSVARSDLIMQIDITWDSIILGDPGQLSSRDDAVFSGEG